MKSDVRTIVMAGLLLAAHCTEWVPANLTDAMGQESVLVHGGVDAPGAGETRPTTCTLDAPSSETLRTLRRNGARFEVRRTDVAATVVVTTAILVGLGLFVGALAYAGSKTFSFGAGGGNPSGLGALLWLTSDTPR